MSKMFFTFKWGKSVFITDEQLKKFLLKYYTKTEVDEILKQYAKNEDVAAELISKLDVSEFEEFKAHLETELIDKLNVTEFNQYKTQVGEELDTKAEQRWVEQEIERLDTDISNNGESIGNVKTLVDDVINQLQTGKILIIDGVYNPNITYKQFRLVFSEESANANLYLSLQDNNIGHPLSDINWWKNLGAVGGSVSLDNYYTKNESDAKYVNLTGTQTISGNKTFSGTTKLGTTTVDTSSGLNIKTGANITNVKALTNGGLSINDKQLATKEYVDSKTPDLSNYVTLDGIQLVTGQKLYSLTPVEDNEIVNKKYVDNAINNLSNTIGNTYQTKLVKVVWNLLNWSTNATYKRNNIVLDVIKWNFTQTSNYQNIISLYFTLDTSTSVDKEWYAETQVYNTVTRALDNNKVRNVFRLMKWYDTNSDWNDYWKQRLYGIAYYVVPTTTRDIETNNFYEEYYIEKTKPNSTEPLSEEYIRRVK